MQHRSVSQEVVQMLEQQLSETKPVHLQQTEAFLSLSGAWSDEGDARDIVNEIRDARRESDRFGDKNGLFD